MLTIIRQLRELVAEANRLAAVDSGDAPRWSVFLTNRSFIAAALAVALNIAQLAGVPLAGWLQGIAPSILADQFVELVTALLLVWSAIERAYGKTRAVWNLRQAKKAVEEAVAIKAAVTAAPRDELAEALRQAGAPVAP